MHLTNTTSIVPDQKGFRGPRLEVEGHRLLGVEAGAGLPGLAAGVVGGWAAGLDAAGCWASRRPAAVSLPVHRRSRKLLANPPAWMLRAGVAADVSRRILLARMAAPTDVGGYTLLTNPGCSAKSGPGGSQPGHKTAARISPRLGTQHLTSVLRALTNHNNPARQRRRNHG